MAGPVDGDRLREVMRRVASPVTVVTFLREGVPHGVTIGSFTSVSLNPPQVLFNVDQSTSVHDLLVETERFVVNILSSEQADLANHFALSDLTAEEQFDPVSFRIESQTVILDDVLSTLVCQVRGVHEAGDSTIMVGEVVEAEIHGDRAPLLYYNRTYREVGDERQVSLFSPVNRSSKETL